MGKAPFGVLALCGALACIPVWSAQAQKCVAQGGGSSGWQDHCSRTIIIEVERAPQIILGPPQIVWRNPSAEGSRQAPLAEITDPRIREALASRAQTGYQLYLRAQSALRAGNTRLAKAYLEAA